jgi:predicted DNA-binding transcriptional regulator YafY
MKAMASVTSRWYPGIRQAAGLDNPDITCQDRCVRWASTVRGDRLLSILLLLQANGRTSARRLAERLEVSERTIYRDLDALSGAGVPVYSERGPKGGAALLDDFRIELTGLTEEEARALFTFGGPQVAADLGVRPRLEAALRKLLVALPPPHRAGAEKARQRVHVDARPWGGTTDETPHLRTIQDAVWADQRLRIRYRRNEREPVERLVDPYGLVAKAGVWYLVAGIPGQDAQRTYRVSRVESAEPTGESFERPTGFDLATTWDRSRGEFERRGAGYKTLVRVTPGVLPLFLRMLGGRVTDAIEQLEDGPQGTRLSLTLPAAGAALPALAAFGADVEVLEPAEFRSRVAAWARAIVDLYDP